MKVEFTDEIQEKVKNTFAEMHRYYEQRYTPKVKTSKKCNACSLKDICLPVLNKKKISFWVYRQDNCRRGKRMKRLLNTLYVTSGNKYLSLDGENIVVLEEQKK